jgi:hypothetical protein
LSDGEKATVTEISNVLKTQNCQLTRLWRAALLLGSGPAESASVSRFKKQKNTTDHDIERCSLHETRSWRARQRA